MASGPGLQVADHTHASTGL